MDIYLNEIYHRDCVELMQAMDEGCVDLTVTSPPYDDLRNYQGYQFDFERIAQLLYRVTKPGGIVVWVVGDRINNKSSNAGIATITNPPPDFASRMVVV